MEMTDDKNAGRRSIRRQRGRRFTTGLNVCAAVALATLLTVLLNYVAARHYARWTIGRSGYFSLSEKTRGLVGGLETDVTVIGFLRPNHPLYDHVRKLLQEYRYEAEKHEPVHLKIRIVDPDRDLADARDLKRTYDLTEANTVLVECEGRAKYLSEKDLADYQIQLTESGADKKWIGFTGEQAISSAIQSVVKSRRPIVYFLSGHGERAIDDFSQHAGLSSLSRIMVRDNIETRKLILTHPAGVPDDAAALIVAGPDRRLPQAELDMLSDYLEKSGRLLFMLDPITETGLEPLLARWGVKLDRSVAVETGMTLTGRELVVANYGNHPITRRFRDMTTVFYMPRPVEPASGAQTVDKPLVTVLASTTEKGWAESDLEESPARFNQETDRRGPISVAVAVERGAVSGIVLEIKPTRLVVIGDSYFVANGAIGAGLSGNANFFLNALNWLLEREDLLAIGPKVPEALRLDMSRRQLQAAYAVIAGGVPALIGIIGLLVWIRRR